MPKKFRNNRFLQIWVDGALDGIREIPVFSVAARAILKPFHPSRKAEFRDPATHEIFRYDTAKNQIVLVN